LSFVTELRKLKYLSVILRNLIMQKVCNISTTLVGFGWQSVRSFFTGYLTFSGSNLESFLRAVPIVLMPSSSYEQEELKKCHCCMLIDVTVLLKVGFQSN
jgi:hypothetical protein